MNGPSPDMCEDLFSHLVRALVCIGSGHYPCGSVSKSLKFEMRVDAFIYVAIRDSVTVPLAVFPPQPVWNT